MRLTINLFQLFFISLFPLEGSQGDTFVLGSICFDNGQLFLNLLFNESLLLVKNLFNLKQSVGKGRVGEVSKSVEAIMTLQSMILTFEWPLKLMVPFPSMILRQTIWI